jgi:hypothetical protein
MKNLSKANTSRFRKFAYLYTCNLLRFILSFDQEIDGQIQCFQLCKMVISTTFCTNSYVGLERIILCKLILNSYRHLLENRFCSRFFDLSDLLTQFNFDERTKTDDRGCFRLFTTFFCYNHCY